MASSKNNRLSVSAAYALRDIAVVVIPFTLLLWAFASPAFWADKWLEVVTWPILLLIIVGIHDTQVIHKRGDISKRPFVTYDNEAPVWMYLGVGAVGYLWWSVEYGANDPAFMPKLIAVIIAMLMLVFLWPRRNRAV